MVLVGNEEEEVSCEEQDRANANGYFDHELKPEDDQVLDSGPSCRYFDALPTELRRLLRDIAFITSSNLEMILQSSLLLNSYINFSSNWPIFKMKK